MSETKRGIIYSDELEELISMAIADGRITEAERKILIRRAMEEGIDIDEFEMVLTDRMHHTVKNAAEQRQQMDAVNSIGVMNAQKLAELLSNADAAARPRIIKDFPIPGQYSDLMEFIMTMSAKAKNEDFGPEKAAYIAKYDEACIKAQTFYPDDQCMATLLQNTQLSKKRRITVKPSTSWAARNIGILVLWGAVLLVGLIIYILTMDMGPGPVLLYAFFAFLAAGLLTSNILDKRKRR